MKPLLVALVALATALPLCAQSAAQDRLENSPRHHEWVAIEHGGRTLHAVVVYPEVKHRALAVLVLHENRGLTDWVRATADRLAEEGYIAIAPDLLSGSGPAGGRTKDFPTTDAAREAIGQLDPAGVLADLRATAAHARTMPAATGEVAVVGFCWGGSQTWRLALTGEELVVACPFYGSAPAEADFSRITAPVHGFYGGNDARVNSTLEKTAAAMTAANKTFKPVLYEGAGHAYLRAGEETDATPANRAAMEQSWTRLLSLLASSAQE
ncbi:MAG: dienelactone hydrolase family protein [Candidatus Didemnitutus sp.]|nr:dienelactone hydrolase family protein [Candidatus Didemnitutus sp.]